MHWPEGWAEANLPSRTRLLQNGLQFTRAQCNTAACSSSRATFFTGLYPAQHGVKNLVNLRRAQADDGTTPHDDAVEQLAEPREGDGGSRLSRRAQRQAAPDATGLTTTRRPSAMSGRGADVTPSSRRSTASTGGIRRT